MPDGFSALRQSVDDETRLREWYEQFRSLYDAYWQNDQHDGWDARVSSRVLRPHADMPPPFIDSIEEC